MGPDSYGGLDMALKPPRRSSRPGEPGALLWKTLGDRWETPATARLASGESGWAFLEEGGEAFLVIVASERDAL